MTTIAKAAGAAELGPEVDPRTVNGWLGEGSCTLIDVREPDEHARERIAGARLVPLGKLDPGSLALGPGSRVVFHCKSGRRSADAATRAGGLRAGGVQVYTMRGGLERWKAESLPVVAGSGRGGGARIGVMQQTQLIIGTLVLAGLALGWFIHPVGFLLSAFMGAGLMLAGFTGMCPLASVVAKLPWNRACSGAACATGGCG